LIKPDKFIYVGGLKDGELFGLGQLRYLIPKKGIFQTINVSEELPWDNRMFKPEDNEIEHRRFKR
tara:strand:+ start:689 stop:883 length:195 start_codon:yes stop_codon:yes gene_type:complete